MYGDDHNYIHNSFFATTPLRKRLTDFLRDLHPDVEFVRVSEISSLTNIKPHEITDLIVSLGCKQISPDGVFRLKEVLDALKVKR